jgi:hypothetical protein
MSTGSSRGIVNGAAGVVILVDGDQATVMGFTITKGLIVEIDAVSDPGRVAALTAVAVPER